MNTYQLTIQHDTGKQRIRIIARDKETAKFVVRMSTGCNVVKVIQLKTAIKN